MLLHSSSSLTSAKPKCCFRKWQDSPVLRLPQASRSEAETGRQTTESKSLQLFMATCKLKGGGRSTWVSKVTNNELWRVTLTVVCKICALKVVSKFEKNLPLSSVLAASPTKLCICVTLSQIYHVHTVKNLYYCSEWRALVGLIWVFPKRF